MKIKKVLVCIAAVVLATLLSVSCPGPASQNPGNPGPKMSLAEARQLLQEQLKLMPGFAGIGHSEETGEIYVFVEDEQTAQKIPRSFMGWPVRVEVTGRFVALPPGGVKF